MKTGTNKHKRINLKKIKTNETPKIENENGTNESAIPEQYTENI